MTLRPTSSRSTQPSRRDCLRSLAGLGLGLCCGSGASRLAVAGEGLREAMYARRLPGGRSECLLCPNHCVLSPGEDGRCRARGNRDGRHVSLVYARPCVINLDPVEKCPLYHFEIAGKALSIATAGCNLSCAYCQNWMYSQRGPDEVKRSHDLPPAAVVAKAGDQGAGAVSFFYTEPTVYYEYMLETAVLARQRGLRTILVTAGYINPEPLAELLPHIDAVTLGLKGFSDSFYRTYVGGELRHVKRTVEILASSPHLWWEAVTLLVPTLNDQMDEIAAMARWLRDVAGADRPLHLTRFRPEYRLRRLPMTPATTLTQAREVALAQGLRHVYVGNLPGHQGANTSCPQCGRLLVERLAFTVMRREIDGGRCRSCGSKIEGRWT